MVIVFMSLLHIINIKVVYINKYIPNLVRVI